MLAVGSNCKHVINTRAYARAGIVLDIPFIETVGSFCGSHKLSARCGNLNLGSHGQSLNCYVSVKVGTHGIGIYLEVFVLERSSRVGFAGSLAHKSLVCTYHHLAGFPVYGKRKDIVAHQRGI